MVRDTTPPPLYFMLAYSIMAKAAHSGGGYRNPIVDAWWYRTSELGNRRAGGSREASRGPAWRRDEKTLIRGRR